MTPPTLQMPRISLSNHGSTPHERLIGHNPAILASWLQLEEALFTSPTFDASLREQMRRALAYGNRCEYCMAKGGRPDVSATDARMSLAVAFADVMGRDHRELGPGHLDVLRESFSEAEIAELVTFAAFIAASQMLGAVLGLNAADLPEKPNAGFADEMNGSRAGRVGPLAPRERHARQDDDGEATRFARAAPDARSCRRSSIRRQS